MATRLSDTAQIYVTGSAALTYAQYTGQQPEEARRELTVLLLDARQGKDTRSGAEQWRVRSRPLSVDVGAHVIRQDGLAVVTHIHARAYKPHPGNPRS